jgi:Rod binding domain-containing protein
MTSPISAIMAAADAATPVKHDDPQKLRKAAQDFESLLISQIFKSVRESEHDSALSGEKDETSDIAMGMAEEQFARAMAARGGLGLANMVVKAQESRDGAKTNTDPASDAPGTAGR